MRVSLKWLSDYVPIRLSPQELADKLTMAGLEVERMEAIGDRWANIFVGQIIEIEKHPQADRLQLALVDLKGEKLKVVCGAPNIEVGQKVPLARVGARVLDPHTGQPVRLKPARIRGVLSEGMLCSERELGISDNHEGIMILSPDAPVGVPLSDYLGDVILDIRVTPNRPDCLSVLGIAREVAALTGEKLRLPQIRYEERGPGVEQLAQVQILAPDLCPRYCAGIVQGVKVGPSPRWMQERLLALGMRPINNLVDITNYVMLEYGQPLHAFDFEKLRGRRIIVRRAREGEHLITLDGEERALSPDVLVIADDQGPVALAGVMGGLESEVTAETSAILIESANFNQASVRRTAHQLNLPTEASLRFEKGLSPELALPALYRALGLMEELVGGEVARGVIDIYPGSRGSQSIRLTERRVKQVLGIELRSEQISGILSSLGFTCEPAAPGELRVGIPYWRSDITVADDLAEEVARIIGYDAIPLSPLSGELPQFEPNPLRPLRERVRDILVGCGMQEVITYSLISREVLEKASTKGPDPIRVANPLSREQEYLRTSLRPGLLRAFAANERRREGGLMLFEVGKVYFPRPGNLPEEREVVCGVVGGPRFGKSWLVGKEMLDFFSAKGILETLFNRLGLEADFEPAEELGLLPSRTAKVMLDGRQVGVLGDIHPQVKVNFDLVSESISLFEICLDELVSSVERVRLYRPLPRFPGVERDLALLADEALPAKRIKELIQGFTQVRRVELFDVYQGERIPPGKKSLTFSVLYQSPERTLTDEEVSQLQQQILEKLEKELGVVLRR